MKFLLDFLFGKGPDIFDEQGRVVHKHPKSKWEAWNKRYFSDPEMNWRNHTGTKAKIKKNSSL
tara:strand:- start:46792 stop:46980 length:189 start_codon:yes stop_codon:yes gene_type:complete